MFKGKKNIQTLLITIIAIVALNWLGHSLYKRFDLTQDQRYTLSKAAKSTIARVNSTLEVDVFLDGDLPSNMKRLKTETEVLLEEFSAYNPNVRYTFYDGVAVKESLESRFESAEAQLKEAKTQFESGKITEEDVIEIGLAYEDIRKDLEDFLTLKSARVTINNNGKESQQLVYPHAFVSFGKKRTAVTLLKNPIAAENDEAMNASIQNLEYAFADAFSKVSKPKQKSVAVLKGNDEMEDRYLADYFATLKDYYYIAQFTLDSVSTDPQGTLEAINNYDLLVAAQPKEAFSENEKYVLDQFTMNGGASLWLVDATTKNIDSVSGNTFVFPRELGLNDFFFKYGIRINRNLVKDIYAAPITLETGEGRETQQSLYPWLYSPLSASANNHPISTNIEAVKFNYVSEIELLPSKLNQTVLLSSSPISKLVGLPAEIDFNVEIPKNLQIVNEGPNPEEYNAGEIPFAVLLEGNFPSVYANRIKPFRISEGKETSIPAKMIVVSDGDIIKNQLDRGRPLELGFDPAANAFYGNKEFLLNAANYLLDDNGLINIRTKEIAIAYLDPQKASEKRGFWQIMNVVLPLGLLAVFGIFFQYLRKRKYAS